MNRATAATAVLALGTMVAAASIVPAMAAPRPAAAHPVAHAKKTASRGTATAKAAKAKTSAGKTSKAAAKVAAQAAKAADPTIQIGSEEAGGKYVTVVTCHGAVTPPPIKLGAPGTPLTASGVGPSAGLLAMLKKPNPYKTIYTCTVVVKEKVPSKPKPKPKPKPKSKSTSSKSKARPKVCEIPAASRVGGKCVKQVTVETGFGGLAPQVRLHHPAG